MNGPSRRSLHRLAFLVAFTTSVPFVVGTVMTASRAVAAPKPAPSTSASTDNVILVGAFGNGVVVSGKDDGTDSITALLHEQIIRGLIANPAYGSSGTHVLSYYDTLLEKKTVATTFAEVSKFAGTNMETQFSYVRDAKKVKPTDFLRVTVLPIAADEIRVDFDLYDIAAGWAHTEAKSLGTCGQTKEEVIDLARDAMLVFRRPGTNEKPQAVVSPSVAPSSDGVIRVPIGTEVILDGCRSSDPEHDALTWKWTQSADEKQPRVVPTAGAGGQRLRFVPEQDGSFTLTMRVTEVLHSSSFDERTVKVEAYRKASAVVPESAVEVFDEQTPTWIALDGAGSEPKDGDFVWRQIEGPEVAIVSDRMAKSTCTTKSASCWFRAPAPAKYTFELEVSKKGVPKDIKRVSFLVARKPQIILPAKETQTTRYVRLQLRVAGSVDELDPAPSYFWRIEESETNACHDEKGTTASTPTEAAQKKVIGDVPILDEHPTAAISGALLEDPTSARPTFMATTEGDYWVSVTVMAQRRFNDRNIYQSTCAYEHIVVAPRKWEFALNDELYSGFPSEWHEAFLQPTMHVLYRAFDVGPLGLSAYVEGGASRIDLRATVIDHSTADPALGGGVEASLPRTWSSVEPYVHVGYQHRFSTDRRFLRFAGGVRVPLSLLFLVFAEGGGLQPLGGDGPSTYLTAAVGLGIRL